MAETDLASVAFKAGRALCVVVLLLLAAAATYAGVMAFTNWSSISV